jgi:hypothetical protein
MRDSLSRVHSFSVSEGGLMAMLTLSMKVLSAGRGYGVDADLGFEDSRSCTSALG